MSGEYLCLKFVFNAPPEPAVFAVLVIYYTSGFR